MLVLVVVQAVDLLGGTTQVNMQLLLRVVLMGAVAVAPTAVGAAAGAPNDR